MKKLLVSLSIIGAFSGMISIASANSTSCKDVDFASSVTACVNIEDGGTNTREVTTTVDGGSTANLKCDIMTPDSAIKRVSLCNGSFSYSTQRAGRIKLRIRYNDGAPTTWDGKPSSSSARTYPQWVYDFDNGGRTSSSSNSSSSNDLDNFYLTTDDTTPTTTQYVDLTVKARDNDNATVTDYNNKVKFTIYYRAAGSSSRTSTTSSTYYTMNSSYTNGYTFLSSNDGIKTLSDFIRFNRNNYDYKVKVYDEDETTIYKEITFTVGNTDTSSDDLDNFSVTTDDTTPTTSQYIDLIIRARDSENATVTDYTNKVKFTIYYKASGSSTRTSTTSSTYYTMNSSYTNGYTFLSSNNGVKTLSDFIRFNRNNYDYKVKVYDEDDTTIYKEITFTVGTTNSNDTVDGFTASELALVESIYDAWDDMIINLKATYSLLRNSTTRKNMSDDFKEVMREIIDDEDNKTYDNYDDFNDAFIDWYNYTVDLRS